MTTRTCSVRTFFRAPHDSPISRIGTIVLVLGLAAGCSKSQSGTPTSPGGVPSPGSTIVYDAVGASDADGVGSSVVCPPFVDCPNGMGYPQIAARQLQAQGFTVSLTNFGIPTATLGPTLQALGAQLGRLIVGNFL